mmetsp:Transcript_56320/g.133067  ORF Transcript_56320/g.133067 Transcript_56320/m.133067 type:complete len:246 (+) Transcript_56320:411-1148(+)
MLLDFLGNVRRLPLGSRLRALRVPHRPCDARVVGSCHVVPVRLRLGGGIALVDLHVRELPIVRERMPHPVHRLGREAARRQNVVVVLCRGIQPDGPGGMPQLVLFLPSPVLGPLGLKRVLNVALRLLLALDVPPPAQRPERAEAVGLHGRHEAQAPRGVQQRVLHLLGAHIRVWNHLVRIAPREQHHRGSPAQPQGSHQRRPPPGHICAPPCRPCCSHCSCEHAEKAQREGWHHSALRQTTSRAP